MWQDGVIFHLQTYLSFLSSSFVREDILQTESRQILLNNNLRILLWEVANVRKKKVCFSSRSSALKNIKVQNFSQDAWWEPPVTPQVGETKDFVENARRSKYDEGDKRKLKKIFF